MQLLKNSFTLFFLFSASQLFASTPFKIEIYETNEDPLFPSVTLEITYQNPKDKKICKLEVDSLSITKAKIEPLLKEPYYKTTNLGKISLKISPDLGQCDEHRIFVNDETSFQSIGRITLNKGFELPQIPIGNYSLEINNVSYGILNFDNQPTTF